MSAFFKNILRYLLRHLLLYWCYQICSTIQNGYHTGQICNKMLTFTNNKLKCLLFQKYTFKTLLLIVCDSLYNSTWPTSRLNLDLKSHDLESVICSYLRNFKRLSNLRPSRSHDLTHAVISETIWSKLFLYIYI